jgi:crotonobetainyl-CoA:carnitine CoA-transferase CaiB-like acyl-CoA transferase
MPEALENLHIVDFSRVLAGPLATMVLGDFGAEVTKVERPGTGDDTRAWGPPYDETGMATYFQSVNRNKRSVALDLHAPADLECARQLVAGADVLVENFRPGLMDELGLGYEDMSAANPGLVYCSITGFGAAPVAATLPGYDMLVQALGGLMSITGSPEGEPLKVGVALVDVICGLFAACGILAALRHRDRAGPGQRVEIDLLSSLLAALVNQGSAFTLAGEVAGPRGNAHPSIAPYELLCAADGAIVIAVGTDKQFRALTETLGRPELADEPDFASNSDRVANRARLSELLEARLSQRPAGDWVAELTAARVPAGKVNDIAGGFALAEELGLEPIVEVPRAGGGVARLTRNPIRLSVTPASYRTAPPALPTDAPSSFVRSESPSG